MSDIAGQPGQRWGPAHIPEHLTEPELLPKPAPVLTREDRCDKHGCGRPAQVRMWPTLKYPIDMCGYHFDKLNAETINNLSDYWDERLLEATN